MTYNNVLCVIPARAGSKGIKDKNLQLIGDIPLVEHSILHALNAGIPHDQIVVSSDGDKILDIALRNRVIADERPSSISGPSSSTEETLLWVYDHHVKYCSNKLKACEHILLLQPTSPIRFKETLPKFLDWYLDGNFDSALTTTKFYNFFWQEGDVATSSYSPKNRPMRQALQASDYRHFENGNMYLTHHSVLQSTKCRLGHRVGIFPITELEGMQIDTHEDLEIFRAIFSERIAEKVGL